MNNFIQKKIVAIDLSISKTGGPYHSTLNLMNSKLKEKYDFISFDYDYSIGYKVSLRRIWDLKRKIEVIHPDIVHCSGLQLSGFHIVAASKLAHVKKIIVTVRGSSTEAHFISSITKGIIKIFEYITLLLCDYFYGVSDYASKMDVCKSFKKKNLGHIYNLPTTKYLYESDVRRSDFGFDDNDIVVASVARITIEKGYAVFTEAIKIINSPYIKFIVVGDGEYKDQMEIELKEEICNGRVVMTGKRDDVGSLLKLADIFVLPTFHETLSVSLLEAGSAGLPLIASRVGGVPEVIDDNKNGFLIDPKKPGLIKEKIELLAGDPELRKQIGECAKQLIAEKFDVDKLLNQIEDVYEL